MSVLQNVVNVNKSFRNVWQNVGNAIKPFRYLWQNFGNVLKPFRYVCPTFPHFLEKKTEIFKPEIFRRKKKIIFTLKKSKSASSAIYGFY